MDLQVSANAVAQAVADVLDADVGTVTVSRKAFGNKAGAVVDHADLPSVRVLAGTNDYFPLTLPILSHPVGHGIFHDGLKRQGGDSEVCTLQIIFYLQRALKAQLLNRKEVFDVFQLRCKGNGLIVRQRVHIMPQVFENWSMASRAR